MAVAHEIRLAINGRLPNGEIWSTGYSLDAGPTTMTQATLNTVSANGSSQLTATNLRSVILSQLPTTGSIDTVSAYYYASSGAGATLSSTATFNQPGTGTGNVYPNQLAVVASLRTGLPGRARRGRMYLPFLTGTFSAGQLSLANCTSIAQAVRDYLDAMETATGYTAVVSSDRLNAMTQIKSVIVDSKIDIQRRRANRQLASFRFEASLV